MSERILPVQGFHEIVNGAIAPLFRAQTDLESVARGILDAAGTLPSFDRVDDLREASSMLRARAAQTFAAAMSINASAASFELLAEVVAHSGMSPTPPGSKKPKRQ